MYLSQVRPLPLSRPRSVRGERPQVYAWAGIEQLEIKYEASSSLLTLKFRTFMAGGGNLPYMYCPTASRSSSPAGALAVRRPACPPSRKRWRTSSRWSVRRATISETDV